MFAAAKDAMTARAAQAYVNNLIGRYGRVTELRLDTKLKTLELTCELIGESEPLGVRVFAYELIEEDGKKFVRVTSCSSTRVWLDRLLKDRLCGRRLALPPWAAAAL